MKRSTRFWVPSLLIAVGAFSWSQGAFAIDSERRRILVDFGAVPCMQRVDRSVDPVVQISWTVDEQEAYPIPDDEVPGGRTHQLLALARQEARQLPTWVSQADVDATEAVLQDGFGEPQPEHIFDLSPEWPAGSWTRVTPDDPRIQITNEAASAGASWDTSELDPGAYQVIGYTYDPPVNITSRREGLFKVVDGEGAGPPALYMEPVDLEILSAGSTVGLPACVDAAAGSTFSVFIGEVIGGDNEIEWRPVEWSADAMPTQGELNLAIELPSDAGGSPVRNYKARVDVQDPSGATYTAYSPRIFRVAEGDGSDEGESGDGGETGGGGCSQAEPSRAGALLTLFGLLAWRRRRSKLG